MEQIYVIIISLATLLNAFIAIGNFIGKLKKPVDNVVDKKFEKALEPINNKLNNIDKRIDELDKSECKNYLTEFIEDVKNGVVKSDIQKQRATEVYDHYRKDLHGNSYIHDGWQKYVEI